MEGTYKLRGSQDNHRFDLTIPAQRGTGVMSTVLVSSPNNGLSTSLTIAPMPTYLNGIAKDATGNPIAYGTVSVYPEGVKGASYTTQTDAAGHFVIEPAWIPPFQYSLVYTTSTGEAIPVTTARYLKENKEFHESHAIDSFVTQVNYVAPTQTPDEKTAQIKRAGTNAKLTDNGTTINVQQKTNTTFRGTQTIMVLILVILLLIGAGVGIYIYIQKKSSRGPSY